MDPWSVLVRALDDLPAESLTSPVGGRLGAALVLLGDPAGTGDLDVVLTRRRDDLATHPGQLSFPGGRVEPGETVEDAAVREAMEEVALSPGTAQVLGRLPAFYIAPSRFWLQPIVARWHAPHPLMAAEAEVAEILRVPLAALREPAAWRVVRLPGAGRTWAWQLDERHLLWGATAVVTATLLGMLDAGWHGGTDLADLPAEREVRPWETASRAAPARGVAQLPGLVERPVSAVPVDDGVGPPPTPATVAAAGRAVAAAVTRSTAGASDPVLVLAGGGGNGAAGLATAGLLRAVGREVRVVLDRPADRLAPVAAAPARAVAAVSAIYDGVLPPAGIVVDALVGGGLSGELGGLPRDVVLALRHQSAPVVAVDTPSGVHPVRGLVGACVPADLTVALGALRPGLLGPGMGPFVGDLYLAGLDEQADTLVRLVPDAPDTLAAKDQPVGPDGVIRQPRGP